MVTPFGRQEKEQCLLDGSEHDWRKSMNGVSVFFRTRQAARTEECGSSFPSERLFFLSLSTNRLKSITTSCIPLQGYVASTLATAVEQRDRFRSIIPQPTRGAWVHPCHGTYVTWHETEGMRKSQTSDDRLYV